MDGDHYIRAQERILRAYSPKQFKLDAQTVFEAIATFLMTSQLSEGSVLNWQSMHANMGRASKLLNENSGIDELINVTLKRGQTIHDPRYMGHQVPPPIPITALFEAVSSILNQGMTVYEMGPWSSAVERVMIKELGEQLGLKEGFGGILTSGGSLANLTALLAARNTLDKDVWSKGVTSLQKRAVILSHGESHYSIERAAGILGIGTENNLKTKLDNHSKMDPIALEYQIKQLKKAGQPIIAVVASACSTRTGVFDPIKDIAAVCKQHGIWLHVDAAHGGSVAFSEKYCYLLEGIDLANSIVWDAHKMMFMPALSTYLFYRNSQDQYQSLNQNATYLFDAKGSETLANDTGLGTIECTKRAAALSLWGVWAIYGKQLFGDLVDMTFYMAKRFSELIEKHPDFDLLNQPESNIILFRYLPPEVRYLTERKQGEFQKKVRKCLIESGESYIVPAIDNNISALRMVIMNPLTTERHFNILIQALQKYSKQFIEELAGNALIS